jgi:hypothetical protein
MASSTFGRLRAFLSRARVVALCFPLYGLMSSFCQGCGGSVDDRASGPDSSCSEEGCGYG